MVKVSCIHVRDFTFTGQIENDLLMAAFGVEDPLEVDGEFDVSFEDGIPMVDILFIVCTVGNNTYTLTKDDVDFEAAALAIAEHVQDAWYQCGAV